MSASTGNHFTMDQAQLKPCRYANIIGNEIVRRWCPIAWQAFVDYRLKALVLTRIEKELIGQLSKNRRGEPCRYGQRLACARQARPKHHREREELEKNLEQLSLQFHGEPRTKMLKTRAASSPQRFPKAPCFRVSIHNSHGWMLALSENCQRTRDKRRQCA